MRSVKVCKVSTLFQKCCTDAEVLKDQTSDLTEELSVLKEFDLDSEFGPCIGMLYLLFITHKKNELKRVKYLFQLLSRFNNTWGRIRKFLVSWTPPGYLLVWYIYFLGITRLQRWERAKEYGLYPPEEVKEIILKHPDDTAFTEW